MISFMVMEDYKGDLKLDVSYTVNFYHLFLLFTFTYDFMKSQYIHNPYTIYLLISTDNSTQPLCVFVVSINKIQEVL